MGRALRWAALLSATLAAGPAFAQNAAAPAAEAPVPPQPVTSPPPSTPSPGSGPIAAIQQQLQQAGYAPGPINGVMTDKTRQAVALYRRRTGHLPAGAEADPVKEVQSSLQRLGLFAGPVDGALGPQTRDAIIRFEAQRHLAIDPRVSDRLLTELAQAGGNQGKAAPPPAEPNAGPAAPPPAASPEALGRRPLPSWVNPPPIR